MEKARRNKRVTTLKDYFKMGIKLEALISMKAVSTRGSLKMMSSMAQDN